MPFTVAYITHSDRKEAKRIVLNLLKLRLIACTNTFPIDSLYWWHGKIESAHEVVTLVKFRSGNWTRIKMEVEGMHKYETPCIMRLRADANRRYDKWVNAESKANGRPPAPNTRRHRPGPAKPRRAASSGHKT